MVKITVTSTENGQPSEIQLQAWQADWAALTGLSAWINAGGGKSCTTTSTLPQTTALAGAELTTWKNADQHHRDYTIATVA